MRKIIFCIAILFMLAGCATSQCEVATRTLNTAQVAYDEAKKSGQTTEIDKYAWTLSAAKAVVVMWCSGVPAEPVPK